jgi:hypothetical protein
MQVNNYTVANQITTTAADTAHLNANSGLTWDGSTLNIGGNITGATTISNSGVLTTGSLSTSGSVAASSTAAHTLGPVTFVNGAITGATDISNSGALTTGSLSTTGSVTASYVSCKAYVGVSSNFQYVTLQQASYGDACTLRIAFTNYASNIQSAIDCIQNSSNNFASAFSFKTNTGGSPIADPVEALYLASNQRVGINCNAPASTLDVNGSAQIASSLMIGSNVSSGVTGVMVLTTQSGSNYIESGSNFTVSSAAPLIFTTMSAGAEWARFDATGKFGIGTNNPTYKLDVNGGIRGTSITTGCGNTSARQLGSYFNSPPYNSDYVITNNIASFTSNSTSILTVNSDSTGYGTAAIRMTTVQNGPGLIHFYVGASNNANPVEVASISSSGLTVTNITLGSNVSSVSNVTPSTTNGTPAVVLMKINGMMMLGGGGNGTNTQTITFTSNFTNIPSVVCTCTSATNTSIYVTNTTLSNFSVQINGNGYTGSYYNWIAIGLYI